MEDTKKHATEPDFEFSISDAVTVGSKELIDNLFSTSYKDNPDDLTSIKKDEKEEEEEVSVKKEEPLVKKKEEPKSKKKEEPEVPEPEDEEKQEEEEEEEDNSKVDGSIFASLAKDLFKHGVFTPTDDEDPENIEINTPEELLERFDYEKKKGAIETLENFLGQFGDEYKNAFEAIFVKGVNPREYFGTYSQIEDLSKMDLSIEANQIAVVKKALAEQGFEPEDINTEIERLRNYGDLESVATKHHKALVKRESAKLKELEQKKEEEQKQKMLFKRQYEENISNIISEKLKKREFDGIPINQKIADELHDFLVTEKYRTPSGDILTEFDKAILELRRPENHEKRVKVALILQLLEKDPTLSVIQRTGMSKKTNSLFEGVVKSAGKAYSGEDNPKSIKSWFS